MWENVDNTLYRCLSKSWYLESTMASNLIILSFFFKIFCVYLHCMNSLLGNFIYHNMKYNLIMVINSSLKSCCFNNLYMSLTFRYKHLISLSLLSWYWWFSCSDQLLSIMVCIIAKKLFCEFSPSTLCLY